MLGMELSKLKERRELILRGEATPKRNRFLTKLNTEIMRRELFLKKDLAPPSSNYGKITFL